MFVIDTSSSIKEGRFQLIREFTANITTKLINNSPRSAVGVILFSNTAHIELNLQAHTNLSALLSAINGLPYNQGQGRTNLVEALKLLLDRQLGLRNGSSKIAIVITDEQSSDMSTTFRTAAKLINNSLNIFDIYAVGVGDATQNGLESIASSPELVFSFDINGLQQLVDAILLQLCAGK